VGPDATYGDYHLAACETKYHRKDAGYRVGMMG
jgi:hypothetical protein